MILKAVASPLVRITFVSLPLLALSMSVQAADDSKSLTNCQTIADRTARFECYDKSERVQATIPAGATQSTIPAKITAPAPATAATTAAVSTGGAQVTTAPAEPAKKPFYKRWLPFGWGDDKEEAPKAAEPQAPTAAPDSTVANYGLTPKSPTGGSASVGTSNGGIKELTDTIAEVKKYGANTRTITLSSGQVWRQMYDQTYDLKPGDKITIKPTGWGTAYRLYCDRLGSFIQVRRIDQ